MKIFALLLLFVGGYFMLRFAMAIDEKISLIGAFVVMPAAR